MPAIDSTPNATLERANELYWSSDRTVEEITRELQMGRSTLYAAVRPVPAGVECAACGEGMVFTNRSNRDGGTATCPACTAEAHLNGRSGAPNGPAIGVGFPLPGEELGDHGSAWTRWREELAAVSPQRAVMVGGAAALGAVVGAAAARIIRS